MPDFLSNYVSTILTVSVVVGIYDKLYLFFGTLLWLLNLRNYVFLLFSWHVIFSSFVTDIFSLANKLKVIKYTFCSRYVKFTSLIHVSPTFDGTVKRLTVTLVA